MKADLDRVRGRADRLDLVGGIREVRRRPAGGRAICRVLLDDVRRDVRVRRLGGPVGQVHLAPVELVVAEGRHVVAHRVVGRDGGDALARRRAVTQVGQQASLHLVAGVDEQDVGRTDGRTDVIDHRRNPGAAGVAVRSLQLAVEVVRVQDRERDRAGRGGARWRRNRRGQQRRGDKQQDRPGTSHGGTSEDEGTRGRAWPALSADQHKGTEWTLAPRPLAGHGRTAVGFTPIGTIESRGRRMRCVDAPASG